MSAPPLEVEPASPRDAGARIVGLFVLVLAFQPVQMVLIGRFGEFYPSLTLPSFRGTLVGRDGRVTSQSVDLVVSFADGATGTLTPATLMAEAPASHRGAMVAFAFGPPGKVARAPEAAWKAALKARLVPGTVIRARRWDRDERDPRRVAWLGSRLRALFPERTPVRAEFRWYQDAFATEGRAVVRSRRPIGVYRVNLADAR